MIIDPFKESSDLKEKANCVGFKVTNDDDFV